MDLAQKADRLLERALEVLEDESIPPNRRNWLHYDFMQKFCVVSQMRYTDDGVWQMRAQEWGKRKEAANKAIADDETADLRKRIEQLQANSRRLEEL